MHDARTEDERKTARWTRAQTEESSPEPSPLGTRRLSAGAFPTDGICTTRAGSNSNSNSSSSSSSNAARERSRVRTLRAAFLELQRSLPAVPRDTKLSKLDVLLLATAYIAHLSATLDVASERPTACRSQPTDATSISEAVTTQKWKASSRSPSLRKPHRHTETLSATEQSNCTNRNPDRGEDSAPTAFRIKGDYCDEGGEKLPHVRSGLRGFGYLHPVKKWPMRARLYAGIMASASGVKLKNASSNTASL
ncbi:uncharacterized protein LOC143294628 [Babylonia areolata]|uniref:uncharacterized protein LOC143294628 n=1 Tax=Babylonia areolata TaxID=304850 RepID=UPI003FCEE748